MTESGQRHRSWDRVTRYAGLLAAGLGVVALLGWISGASVLATFGDELIPMAPSTALLFIALGIGSTLDRSRWLAATTMVATLLALLLLVTSSLGFTSSVEHLGLEIRGMAAGAPVGHMSPLTALAFVLAGLSLLADLGVPDSGRRSPRAAFFMAVILEIVAGVLTSGYFMSQPLLYETGIIPPALPTSLGFLVLGLGLVSRSALSVWPDVDQVDRTRPGAVLVTSLFVAGAAIITAATVLFDEYQEDVRREVEQQLDAIADLKVSQIEHWRSDLLTEARTLTNPIFARALERALSNDDDARATLRRWVRDFAVVNDHPRVSVHDADGRALVTAAPDGYEADEPHDPADIRRVLAAGEAELQGFHRDAPGGPLHMTVAAPVRGEDGTPLGAVAIRIDPARYLFPALQRWPTPSRTAETLIVRRDGDDVLFLSPLRFRDDAPGTFRLPLASRTLPASAAIMGAQDIVEGMDYRGEPVIAAVRMVEGSPWRLVARMDRAEVFAPVRERMRTTILFIGFLLLGMTALVGFGWQRREKVHYRSLAQAERRYRTLYEAAPIGIFRTRSDGQALGVNPTMAAILGFPSAEAAVRHYVDLGEQLYVDADRRDEFLARIASQTHVEGFQYRARRADGSVIWIEMNARVARTHPDGTFEIEGFAWDVTARKEAAVEAERQRAMLERTERIAEIGSWEFDVATGEVVWSEELYRIFGLDPARRAPALDESGDLFPPEEAERLRVAVDRALEHGERYDLEIRAIRADGETRLCRARGYPEEGPGGQVVRLYGTLSDITEEKRREEREAELRAQLAQSQKMETVGRLAGGVAHDFNNMLSVILGHAELAMESVEEDGEVHAELEDIHAAALRSSELTRQLLAFAREQIVVPQVLDLNETVDSMLKMLKRVIGEEIELVWEPADQVWPVRMDPAQVDQILVNLLVNARDAIDGVGTVTIRTECTELDVAYVEANPDASVGEYVCLMVSDTGCGMEPGVAERIFEPFFSTKAEGEGTGLGLSTVYGIVRQNDGHINVYSEPGQGTTFRIYLPRSDAELDGAASDDEDTESHEGTETVLVVEDQPALLGLTRRILSRLGYTVLGAEDPREALELAGDHEGRIDLLLTDVVMPEMNGRDLAERLRGDRPELEVLFMSGYPADVIADRGVIREGVRFIEKPFTVAELSRAVRSTLDAARAEA